jgi:uncharacterized protein YqjF (DUF2071 family)
VGTPPWNQEFSVSVQHELAPRVSVDVGYFRRWYGNFTVVDNRAVGPADYISYSFVRRTDPRLALSGQVIDGLLEVVPAKAGLVDNYTTFATTTASRSSTGTAWTSPWRAAAAGSRSRAG